MLSEKILKNYDIRNLDNVDFFLKEFPKLTRILEEELLSELPKYFKQYFLELDHDWNPEYDDQDGTLSINIIVDLEVDEAMKCYNSFMENYLIKSKFYESCRNNAIIDISWHEYIKS